MNEHLYPSYIICQTGMFDVLNHEKLEPVDEGSRCRLCAMPISEGVSCKHMSKSMTNIGDIALPHAPHVCKYCMTVLQPNVVKEVQGYQDDKSLTPALFGMLYIGGEKPKAVRVTHDQANKFVLNPPVPKGTPFVFMRRVHHVLSNGASRHSAWMARVSLNSSNYYLQIGTDALQVDTAAVKSALKILRKVVQNMETTYPYPIYGADFLVGKIVRGDKGLLQQVVSLSDYSHDTILVAAHLIESKTTAGKLNGKTGAVK